MVAAIEPLQIVFGVGLVIVLLALAGFFAWRQWETLRRLHLSTDLPADERRYTRNQAWRRLVCCGLMVVMAALLAISFVLEGPASEVVRQKQPLNPEQQKFFNFYARYWLVTLLVLMGMIALAAADLFAIRRYGRRQYRQIQEDRRAMIKEELARLRSRRNGHM